MWNWFRPTGPAPRPFPAADERLARDLQALRQRHDKRVFWGLFVQWSLVLVATFVAAANVDINDTGLVWSALLWNGGLTSLAMWQTLRSPGSVLARWSIGTTQALMSVMLLSVSGGRIETHLHLFVWLAALAVYRDVWLLVATAGLALAGQFLLGMIVPDAGLLTAASIGHWSEHAVWLVVETGCLVAVVEASLRSMTSLARREAALEALNKNVERKVERRTRTLAEDQERLRRENEQLRESRHTAEADEAETLRQLSRLRGGVSTHATALMDVTWRWNESTLPEALRPHWRTIRESAQELLGLLAETTSSGQTCSSSLIGLEEFNGEPVPASEDAPPSDGSRALLLIDDPVQQTLAIHALAREGFEVDVVRSGPRTYYSVMMRDYDVIVIDVDLAQDEGFDTIEALKMLPNTVYSTTGLFALTSDPSADTVLRVTDLGVDGLLTKPVDPVALHRLLTGPTGEIPQEKPTRREALTAQA